MKKFYFTLLVCLFALSLSAKRDYVPYYFTQINLEEAGIFSDESSINSFLPMSDADGRFTITVIHDTLTAERVSEIKRLKAARALSIIGAVAGSVSAVTSSLQTPLTPMDAKWQAIDYMDSRNNAISSTYEAMFLSQDIDAAQKLPISVIIDNNSAQELYVNDMARGLIWYIRPGGSLSLSVGNPEVNRLRIANADSTQPNACYLVIQAGNYISQDKVSYEDDDVWLIQHDKTVANTSFIDYFILKDKHTMEEVRLEPDEGKAYKKSHKK